MANRWNLASVAARTGSRCVIVEGFSVQVETRRVIPSSSSSVKKQPRHNKHQFKGLTDEKASEIAESFCNCPRLLAPIPFRESVSLCPPQFARLFVETHAIISAPSPRINFMLGDPHLLLQRVEPTRFCPRYLPNLFSRQTEHSNA